MTPNSNYINSQYYNKYSKYLKKSNSKNKINTNSESSISNIKQKSAYTYNDIPSTKNNVKSIENNKRNQDNIGFNFDHINIFGIDLFSDDILLILLIYFLYTEGVKDIHDLKTHSAGPMVYVQGHIVLDGGMSLFDAHEIVSLAEKRVRVYFPDAEITLHMEPDNFETRTSVNFTDEI